MKLKSLLFGSAAVLAAGTGAQAADLPVAEPVEFVRICDTFGTGYYFIPGTETCLRVYGRVRIESHFVDGDNFVTPLGDAITSTVIPGGLGVVGGAGGFTDEDDVFVSDVFPTAYTDEEREFNNYTTRARGNIRLDARTQTDFGLVRAFIDFQSTVGPSDYDIAYGTSNDLVQAFIQVTNDFGTYTAGHTSSFFDAPFSSNTFGTRVGIDDPTLEQTVFGYTIGFGSGFSATLAVEDPLAGGRRANSGTSFATFEDGPLSFGGPGGGEVPFGSTGNGFDSYEGQEAPDLVGNIRVDGGFGSAQIMGVVRQIHDEDNFEAGFPLLLGTRFAEEPPLGTDEDSDGDEIGFAVGAGANINLPFFGLGFGVAGGYSEGAIRYITSDPIGNNAFGGLQTGDFLGPDADSQTEAFNIRAGITGDFTPTIGFSIDGSYTEVDSDEITFGAASTGDAASDAAGFDETVTFEGVDYTHYAVAGNITYTPVAGLLFGVEGAYGVLELDNSPNQNFALSNFTTFEDEFELYKGMFRVQRDF